MQTMHIGQIQRIEIEKVCNNILNRMNINELDKMILLLGAIQLEFCAYARITIRKIKLINNTRVQLFC